jgi:hypothetical protein
MDLRKVTFEVSHTVHAPIDAVWDVLADFGTEHRWTQTLTHCERDTPNAAVGTVRTCTLPKPLMGRTKVREELTEFEPGVALAYDLDGAAGPFLTASSRWSTQAGAAGTTVLTVEGRFTPRNWLARFLLWPVARPMIRRLTRSVLRELEVFVVSGPAKALPAPAAH